MPQHIFFDLDKTLTMSRSPMDDAHQELFDRLCSEKDVIVVTGGTEEHIAHQITARFSGRYYMLAQSGNDAIGKDGAKLWYEPLSEKQIDAIMRFVEILKKHFNISPKDEGDLVEHRGAQVGYSVIGYHEDTEKKYAFDPGDTKRASALAAYPAEIEMLSSVDVEVTPAGTTSFNFIPAGKHKGYNIQRLLEHEGWKKEDCLYVGDALFSGGNDETVIGVIPTHAVENPDETFGFIRENLLS